MSEKGFSKGLEIQVVRLFQVFRFFLALYPVSVCLLVRCTRNPPLYFAEALENALSGMSADSKDVARVVITRSEVSIIPLGQDIMY